jgi:hypothetical protein
MKYKIVCRTNNDNSKLYKVYYQDKSFWNTWKDLTYEYIKRELALSYIDNHFNNLAKEYTVEYIIK